MAMTICFGTEKGGAGKTTTSSILAHLYSKTKRVLAVDMDLQGNMSKLLSEGEQFNGKTVFQALQAKDPRPYIMKISTNLHLLPADGFLATLPRYLYLQHKGDIHGLLRDTLRVVEHDYDLILIDTPPSLGEHTFNALGASDYVVVMFEPSGFGLDALEQYFKTIHKIQGSTNPKLQIAGVLRTIIDSRRADNQKLVEHVGEVYHKYCFNKVVTRQAAVGRIPLTGFTQNPELKKALSTYWDVLKELNKRVSRKDARQQA